MGENLPEGALFRVRARYLLRAALFLAALALAVAAPILALGAPAERGPRDQRRRLQSNSTAERIAAAEAIRLGSGEAPRSEVEAALRAERNPQARYTLLSALAAGGSPEVVPVLADSLQRDPAPIVRQAAAQELARYAGEPAALKALARGLSQDPEAEVRRACAYSIGMSRSTEAVAALEAAAADSDPELRRNAAWGLLRVPRGREADRALDRLEKDSDARVAGEVKARRRKK